MATKYWSGSGTWDAASPNWGTSPGGPYNVAAFNDGDDAVFEGSAGTVTVSSPNKPNNITFAVAGYTLAGGTITLNQDPSLLISDVPATISALIVAGVGKSLNKQGTGTITLSGANSFSKYVIISGGVLLATHNEAFGAARVGHLNGVWVMTTGQAQLSGGISIPDITLYDDTTYPHVCFKSVSGNNTWGGSISKNGPIVIESDADLMTFDNALLYHPDLEPHALALLGAGDILTTGDLNNANANVTKGLSSGDTGTWTCEGDSLINNFAITTISYGTFCCKSASYGVGAHTLVIGAAGTLSGDGLIHVGNNGVTIAGGGKLAPGDGVGTITIDSIQLVARLVLNATSILEYTLGTVSDKTVLTNDLNLTLDGSINVAAGAGFAVGIYPIIEFSGDIIDNSLDIGTMPLGFEAAIEIDEVSSPKRVNLVVVSDEESYPQLHNYLNNLHTMGMR